MFGELITNVNWVAVVAGAIVAYALGALWFSPKMFGEKWMKGAGLSPPKKGSAMPKEPMIVQAVGTFLLAWVIGVTETTNSLMFALLIAITITVLFKANGMFAQKSKYAVLTEEGYILAMVIIMILAHAVL